MKRLLELLNSIQSLSPFLINRLSSILTKTTLPKGGFLLESGEISHRIYFIEKGLLRCFYKEERIEVSSWFMKEGDVIVSVESFFQQTPSYENIQALEECELYSITYDELQKTYELFPEFNFVGRVLTEKYYRQIWNYVYNTRMKEGKERYQYFVDTFPELCQRVPQKHIASYLGVWQQSLSRIRSAKAHRAS